MAKHVWYEESIGIPLVVGGRGTANFRLPYSDWKSGFYATLLGLLNLPIPETVEGIDCSQDIKGNPMHAEHVCFLAVCPGRDVFLEAFKKAGKNPMDFGGEGVRTKRYVYVVDVGYRTEPD